VKRTLRAGSLAFALVAAGCAADPSHEHGAHVNTANGAPDRVITGPQGGRGQFVVECALSHQAQDDPIVFPGRPGQSHLHDFFGNTTTSAASTLASLHAGGSTCEQALDRAAYWSPALIRAGQVVPAIKSTAYYRAGPDVDPTTVVAYPQGLAMIAGNAAATKPQDPAVLAWTCGTSGERATAPPVCSASRKLRMVVTFPDCWNGRDLDTASHIDHLAYSRAGQCPPEKPVPIPQLQFTIEYDHAGPTDELRLASGSTMSGHADFVNAWDPGKLQSEVELCIHRNIVCGITSGRRTG